MKVEDQSRASLVAFGIALFGAVAFLLLMIGPFLVSLIMGGILALLSRPLYIRLVRRNVRPSLASLAVTLAVVLIIVGPLLTFAALAVKQGIVIVRAVTEGVDLSWPQFMNRLAALGPLGSYIDPDSVREQVEQVLQAAGRFLSGFVLNVAKSIPDAVLQIVLSCLGCYFLLIDGPRFLRWLFGRIPLASDVRQRLGTVFKDTALSVVWASMAAAGAQALIMLLSFLILGVPAAFLAGGVTFVFAFIPVLGSGPVWVSGALYLYVEGELFRALAMVALGVFTGVIDNFVRPWVLKGRGEMHPLVSLVAIFGGIQMFGIFGVFLGPIVTAVVITLLQIWPLVGRRYGFEFAEPPAAPTGSPPPPAP